MNDQNNTERQQPVCNTSISRVAENKKTYSSPQLKVHGSVEEITKVIGTKNSDGVLGSRLV
ncbi:MAG: lasso peptide [Thermodesulfovibrionales bacterium]|jgi:hypothetical protein